ncbi:MAG: LamG domain-containing protein, partial [Bacteroidota bacterium]
MKNLTFTFSLFIILALFSSAFAQNLNQGLVVYYPFSGDADDVSENSLNATVLGAELTSDRDGNANSAYFFNNYGDIIDIGDTAHFNFGQGSFSISYWFKTNATQAYMTVITNGTGGWASGFLAGLNWATGKVIFAVGGGIGNTINSIGILTVNNYYNDDTWHHVVNIVDQVNSIAMIYVDGIKQEIEKYDAFGETGGSLVNDNTELDLTGIQYKAIASHPSTTIGNSQYNQLFYGSLDEVKVYNRAITEEEVLLIHSGATNTQEMTKIDHFKVYPNPVDGEVFSVYHDDVYNLQMFSIIGELVYEVKGISENHEISANNF